MLKGDKHHLLEKIIYLKKKVPWFIKAMVACWHGGFIGGFK